jgi:hypothetical protein
MGFWHSEHNLPRGKLQRQLRDENLRRLRSSLTAAFPLLFFRTASNSRTQWTGHGGEESRTRVKVGNLRITEGFSEARSNYNNRHYCKRANKVAKNGIDPAPHHPIASIIGQEIKKGKFTHV